MADKIDELMVTVASLATDMKHVREKTDAIDNKVQIVHDKSIVTELTMAAFHQRMDKIEPKVLDIESRVGLIEPVVKQIAPIVNNHETLLIEGKGASKAMSGVWALVVAAFSFIGMVVSWFYK